MSKTNAILMRLASGEISVAEAQRLLNPPKPIGRNEKSAVCFAPPEVGPQYRPNTGPKPRPVSPIVSDGRVVLAFRLNEVSKAQTSAMNCYVIELA
jgi:hypothetical protein